MILHVTFSDGSNPWVFYGTRQEVAKHWRRWVKNHPDTAQPVAICGEYSCHPTITKSGFLIRENGFSYGYRKHLGHALAALERWGGG